MTLWCGELCQFAIFAPCKWRKVPFQSIDCCILRWQCWLTRCGMLQDVDQLEASCVMHVEVGTLNCLELNNICVLTITTLGIEMLTVHHDIMFRICCIYDPSDSLRHTSANIVSDEEGTIFTSQRRDFSGCSPWYISVTNTQLWTDLVNIAGRLATRAKVSFAQQDSSCVERVSCLLYMPFWLEANYIFLRTSHFFAVSSSSGLPTSFRYHHLFTSTAPNHASTNTAAGWEWNKIRQNDGRFFRYAICWDPTSMLTLHSSPRRCKCSHWKYDPGRTVTNCL